MAYSYSNSKSQTYYLHSREVTLKGSGKKQRIYYFARQTGAGAMDDLPQGFKVVENTRTGLPVLKKS